MPSQNSTQPLLSISNLTKSFNDNLIFEDVSFVLQHGQVIGLVGSNGSGKTTLLRCILGQEAHDSGGIEKDTQHTYAYIPQVSEQVDTTVRQYLENCSVGVSRKVIDTFSKVNLKDTILDRKIGTLSGGEQNKVYISAVMLQKADVLLLDEPTNNIDVGAREILENYITESSQTCLIASHDRSFLDKVVEKIVVLDSYTKKSTFFEGTYSEYADYHKNMIEKAWQKYGEQKRKAQRLHKVAQKRSQDMRNIEQGFKSKSKLASNISDKDHLNGTLLQGKAGKAGHQAKKLRKKRDAAIQAMPEKPLHPKPIQLSFGPAPAGSRKVFTVENACIKRNGKEIGPISCDIQYGDRLRISGRNGSGKTSFLEALVGNVPLSSGEIRQGKNVSTFYLPQQANRNKTKVRSFIKTHSDTNETDIRKILNRLSIDAEDLKKNITDLSVGEYSRLQLAILASSQANCIILDEPTNHLDLEVLGALEEMLSEYTGTLIVVSHDRYFVDKIKFNKQLLFEETKIRFA